MSFEPDSGTESGLEAGNLEGNRFSIQLRRFVDRCVDICCCFGKGDHRQPKLAVWVLEYFIDSLNIINEQVEMKTQIKKLVNKTLLTFYLLLLDVS